MSTRGGRYTPRTPARRELTVVTHEISFARDVADRVVFADGLRILEEGPPNAMLSCPRHPRTRAFLGAAR
jgi:ABC-type polar amino acid transport system ATPase subunit